MTQWEYQSAMFPTPASRETLNSFGAEGWELVSVLQGIESKQILYVFKRPLA